MPDKKPGFYSEDSEWRDASTYDPLELNRLAEQPGVEVKVKRNPDTNTKISVRVNYLILPKKEKGK